MGKYISFKLSSFNVCSRISPEYLDEEGSMYDEGWDDTEAFRPCRAREFAVQMFGMDKAGVTYCLTARDYKPHFYVLVGDNWNNRDRKQFVESCIYSSLSDYYEDCIVSSSLVLFKKLYGFNCGEKSKFVKLVFANDQAFNKVKGIWLSSGELRTVKFKGFNTELYEAKLPPILRMFHEMNVSPSGWIRVKRSKLMKSNHPTSCGESWETKWTNVEPLNSDDPVPFKIMSFDIEASSSHGDFPLAVKTYRKLAENIVHGGFNIKTFGGAILSAFGIRDKLTSVDLVYPKKPHTSSEIEASMELLKLERITESDVKYEEKELAKTKGYDVNGVLSSQSLKPDHKVALLDKLLTKCMPKLKGDEITFIGSTFLRYGENMPYYNNILSVGECSEMKEAENSEVKSCKCEKDLLLQWSKLVQKEDPDIVIGYNIMGFDYSFMYDRSKELGCSNEFLKTSRNIDEICSETNWKTREEDIATSSISLASGQYDLRYVDMTGRFQVDMYNFFRKAYNLSSYKLDSVAGEFIGDSVIDFEREGKNTVVKSQNLTGLSIGSYVKFEIDDHSQSYYADAAKFKITMLDSKTGKFAVDGIIELNASQTKVKWGLAKDDVTPKQIFELTRQGPDEKAIVAKYCLADCNIVHHLFRKVDAMTGYVEMAKLCHVPMSYIVMRGQGIKLTSYIAKKCKQMGTLMPVLPQADPLDAYEGAVVLEPKCGIYLDEPVACVDYSSLYPSCMISENISHDSKVWTKSYDLEGNLISETGAKDENGKYKYDDLEGYKYVDISYNTYRWCDNKSNRKEKTGHKTCRFAQYPNEGRAIIPGILDECLRARKETKALMKNEKDPFMKNILDKRQLTIKLTANSIYGQAGSKTSTFYDQDVAASTTAAGRNLLIYAKRVVEEAFYDIDIETSHLGKVHIKGEYVYGDTDSVFFKFNPTTLAGEKIIGRDALIITIELAKKVGAVASKFLKRPQDWEYEKTFWPWILLSKKRYVGMLYEEDPDKCKRKSMGIVLKRRDNAPIVKDVYGGIIDILMRRGTGEEAYKFLKTSIQQLMSGQTPIDKLIISKSLRSGYKDPTRIAHNVLAERIGRRDPGNKPAPGDRIQYVFIKTKKSRALQGEKIETPEFIAENGLVINYEQYVTNQISKPVIQLLTFVLEDLNVFKREYGSSLTFWKRKLRELKAQAEDEDKYNEALMKLKEKEADRIIFQELINKSSLACGSRSLTSFF